MTRTDFIWPLHRPPLHYPEGPYPALFATAAARHPERTAIVFHSQRLTCREVEFVDAIPKNPSGKILRRVLRDRVQGRSP